MPMSPFVHGRPARASTALLVALLLAGCAGGKDGNAAAARADGASDSAAAGATSIARGWDAEAARPAMRTEIMAMMDASAQAWNRGDLDAFVADYVPGEGTTFVGSAGIQRGPEKIKERYRTTYFAPGKSRDSLSFKDVEVHPLAPDVAQVIAWYVLSRKDSTVATGPTSLVMLKQDGKWRIKHDHSS